MASSMLTLTADERRTFVLHALMSMLEALGGGLGQVATLQVLIDVGICSVWHSSRRR